MITARAGQTASHVSCKALWSCSNRRRQAVRVQSSRDGGGVDQRISRCASRGCAVVAWRAFLFMNIGRIDIRSEILRLFNLGTCFLFPIAIALGRYFAG